ncbi:glycoside hydrolase family 108 protein [Chitinophaga rhizosphaerae]|uniref:glycoside hydrolase family 108 protein n=1 Tax=Chitinophaga rhizosphaerae TaxID=1864947 RepID=UPI000F805375|nr:glycosyl hydrolase 108 family protein [Chitinophaga rhizosphaerae]
MAEFEPAYSITFQHEGGYVRNPKDRGGETMCGISRRNFPGWQGWRKIDEMKVGVGFPDNLLKDTELMLMVQNFYREEFWNSNRLGEIVHQPIANELFDTGVNMGVRTAARFLQTALNFANRSERDYKDLPVDGSIGPLTLDCVNRHRFITKIFNILNILQGERYLSLVRQDPTQEGFLLGWLNRIEIM